MSRLKSTTLTKRYWKIEQYITGHETWLLRGIASLWEVRRVGNVSTATADEGLYKLVKNVCI